MATDRMLFLNTIGNVLGNVSSDDILILGGDFNCTAQNMDRNHAEPHMPSRRRLLEIIHSNDLSDIWRNFHVGQKQYTWVHSYNNFFSLARLDRFYCFKHQLSFFKTSSIFPVGFSDHSLVFCSFFLESVKPKSAYWHFNTNLLADGHFREVFLFFWREFRNTKTCYRSLQQWWDCAKTQIKQLCQEYTANVTRSITHSVRKLEEEIIELQTLAEQTGNQVSTEILKIKKKTLADFLGLRAQGALVRSRFQSVEMMDVPSKFFFNLECKNGQRKIIHALRGEDGEILSDSAGIRVRAVNFYKELYKCDIAQDQATDKAFLCDLPKVSEEANTALGRVLTLEELERALQSMESGKAPGVDGLPVDFYKSFWPVLGTDVLAVLKDSIARGKLPLSCRRAVLTLLPKKGDLTDIRSWRPVSVLCSEYKLLSKVLANRLGEGQGCPLSGMLYSLAIEPLLVRLRRDIGGLKIPNCDEVFKLSAYADDVAVLVNGQRDINTLLKICDEFKVVSSAKVNWSKSTALLVGEWGNGEPCLPAGLSWNRGGFKYLGVFLGDDVFIQKNFEGVVEKVKGRLQKWKFLFRITSYKGRVLIINNLVASSLWHRLACVDPPSNLLAKIQSTLVDFFWDNLHWVPQSVLYLPKEDGGHGLIHLQSRTAAFRLQFVQRLLTGSVDSSWKAVACCVLKCFGELGMDRSLFWLNPNRMRLNSLPVFYKNLFKVWSLFIKQRTKVERSLFWLLNEPLFYGSSLDVSQELSLLPTTKLISAGVITLGDLVEIAGPELKNCSALAHHLGVRSNRIVDQVLRKWQSLLTMEQMQMLGDFWRGECSPNCQDPFPRFTLLPDLAGCTGCYLCPVKVVFLGSEAATGKSLYKMCVITLNKRSLDKRVDTPWREVLQIDNNFKPQWRALYKSPLTKKVGDLQWRILHGAIAVNAFISVLNPGVDEGCPFCSLRETVFHVFLHCSRLRPLFGLMSTLFVQFNESFSLETFILGFKYVQKYRFKCQLLNFLLGQAKMAVYISRKRKVEQGLNVDVLMVFFTLVRCRILIDFNFYKSMKTLDVFVDRWCYNNVLCTVENDKLQFAHSFEK
ncbi:hypothetical protein ACEWY4_024671 [Coilia grayii]|uniref:Reverse transcriptase domain-containing protein n=1 Tax=Coilia grayii TaxID=363190 RepID=A0ABD1IVR9_9TELE